MVNIKEELKVNKTEELLNVLLKENPKINNILQEANNTEEIHAKIKELIDDYFKSNPKTKSFYLEEDCGREAMERLTWQDYAAIRIMDYIDNAGKAYKDLNLRGKEISSNPFKMLWEAVKNGRNDLSEDFYLDMIYLFRQFDGKITQKIPTDEVIKKWMNKYPAGTDSAVMEVRKKNKQRIISLFKKKIESGEIKKSGFSFPDGATDDEKLELLNSWWDNYKFHLAFAVRTPDLLNEMLNNSLDKETMDILYKAEEKGIPFFVNPYYLSLLNVETPESLKGADLAIRYYVLYSQELVDEFGDIVAWEKEDVVEPGKPNAAGWILPTKHNIHRRYPEVAIMIPDTMGRACGGLCASCQRMYDFQSGNLNFNLDELKPDESWNDKLDKIMNYWEKDSQLRDILITGGDALMSADKTLKNIFEAVYKMAVNKKESNKNRKDGEKYAELLRVRLGTRLPIYLPQRITPELTDILKEFKTKASKVGVKQFVIQTHFQSPMEITPEAERGVKRLISAGCTITNQLVYTSPASRRGHTAQLRKALNDIGVLTYYTFSVKGYMENSNKFATNARAVQEQLEEKILGAIPQKHYNEIKKFPIEAEKLIENIRELRKEANIPFLATDRNVLNLPGVGKSMTYRVIGITSDGRRILEFDHDHTRKHSPIIDKIGRFVIIESKSISEYLKQVDEMGENPEEYNSIWGYSIGETEPRHPIYEYPEYGFEITDKYTNLSV